MKHMQKNKMSSDKGSVRDPKISSTCMNVLRIRYRRQWRHTSWARGFSENDTMAANLNVWHNIQNLTPSIDVKSLEEHSCHISSAPDLKWRSLGPFHEMMSSLKYDFISEICHRQLMHIHPRSNRAKFHPDCIWNNAALGFLVTVTPTRTRTSTIRTTWVAMWDQIPDPKGRLLTAQTQKLQT